MLAALVGPHVRLASEDRHAAQLSCTGHQQVRCCTPPWQRLALLGKMHHAMAVLQQGTAGIAVPAVQHKEEAGGVTNMQDAHPISII